MVLQHFIKDCPERSELKGPPAGYVCKICEGSDVSFPLERVQKLLK